MVLASQPGFQDTPHRFQHDCCARCDDCDICDRCHEYESGNMPPFTLHGTLALFPNIIDLRIDWETSDSVTCNHFQHLKRLHLALGDDTFTRVHHIQATEARSILDHLSMPSLEDLRLRFEVSNEAQGCRDDFAKIRDGLCGIESAKFQHIAMLVSLSIFSENVPEVWVSLPLLSARLSAPAYALHSILQ